MKRMFSIAVALIVSAFGDPDQHIRDQYMGFCEDYRQSCACQYDALRNTLDDKAFAELMGHLAALSEERTRTAGNPDTLQEMPGSPVVRRAYFGAVIACTRDAGF